jgi:hypothetical protein
VDNGPSLTVRSETLGARNLIDRVSRKGKTRYASLSEIVSANLDEMSGFLAEGRDNGLCVLVGLTIPNDAERAVIHVNGGS